MSCTRILTLLDDYVDGETTGPERIEVERHLAGCARCRAEIESLRRLAREVADLPSSIAPPRDLLPSVRVAIARPGRRLAPWLAAAAVLALVALAVPLALRRPADRADDPLTTLRAAEREYERASAEFLATLDERLPALAPETRAAIEQSLAGLDRAIGQVRAAVAVDPANLDTTQTLNALQRRKLRFLRAVSRMSS